VVLPSVGAPFVELQERQSTAVLPTSNDARQEGQDELDAAHRTAERLSERTPCP